jgi:hypothetical protein
MTTMFRWFSVILFLSALAAVATLLISDVLNQLRPTSLHQRSGALAFILIGASFISLHLGSNRPWNAIFKEVFLGTAFVLWGTEQFLPPSLCVTIMDSLVVVIFVIDLSLVIISRMKQR